ncbi:hypothetical protein [Nonomuraea soli]|uniref:Uncharacterized protein n=1 Tax=Nonomuraea soli TaxID=1032476 RepID=A0A7W0HWF8_9ACTN|nr:hypothetical protein [Nonomuraea soli]MBA2897776.1 hypothetical protein [Nonomuraea soli]
MNESSRARTAGVISTPVDRIRNVTEGHAQALQAVGIHTIYDLARSNVFGVAFELARLAEESEDPDAEMVPSDWVTAKGDVAGKTLREVLASDLKVLRSVTDKQAAKLSEGLKVSSVADLAAWPPYREARGLLRTATLLGATVEESSDADSDGIPDFLQPNNANAVETFTYSTMVLSKVHPKPGGSAAPTPIVDAGQLDLAAALAKADAGYQTVAEGARITYSQSWHLQGLALGDLRRTIPLAAGEPVRIAHIDWSRRQAGQRGETGAQSEQLDNATTHNRAMNEVAAATASEAQSGFSSTTSEATAKAWGSTTSPGVLGGLVPGESTTDSGSTNSSKAVTLTSSQGTRNVNSSMSQNIADATTQHATAARSRRATVVEEVSESEAADTSTRMIVNYNHAHALNILYFEVVQNFRADTRLAKVEKLLLVPLKMVDLAEKDLTPAQTAVVASHCRDPQIKDLLLRKLGGIPFTLPTPPIPVPPVTAPPSGPTNASTAPRPMPRPAPILPLRDQLRSMLLGPGNLPSTQVKALSSTSLTLPNALTLEKVTSRDVDDNAEVVAQLTDGTTVKGVFTNKVATFAQAIPVSALVNVQLTAAADQAQDTSNLSLHLLKDGMPVSPLTVQVSTATLNTPLMTVSKALDDSEQLRLAADLQRNKVRYNQALWDELDETVIAMLLADYTYGTGSDSQPLLQWVDPKPIGYMGNYLVFKMNIDPAPPDAAASNPPTVAEEWRDWCVSKGLGADQIGEIAQTQIIAMPTDGLFAEAVLGRANCAEKIDLSRFINWQEMPIPLVPPEINPVDLGTRHSGQDLQPGQFANPMVNIVAPTSLPDPVLAAGTLQALNNGNLFRDMSAAAATVGLAQAAVQSAQAGATAAGQQSTEAQNTAVKAAGDFANTVAQLAATAVKGGTNAGGGLATKSLTAAGGLMNAGKSVDIGKAAKAAANGSAAGSGTSGGAPGGSSGGTVSGGPAGSSAGGGGTTAAPEGEIGYEERGLLAALGQTPESAGVKATAQKPDAAPAPKPAPKPRTQRTREVYISPKWPGGSAPVEGYYLLIVTPPDGQMPYSQDWEVGGYDVGYKHDVDVPPGTWRIRVEGSKIMLPPPLPPTIQLPGTGPLAIPVEHLAPPALTFTVVDEVSVSAATRLLRFDVEPVRVDSKTVSETIKLATAGEDTHSWMGQIKAAIEGKIASLKASGETTAGYEFTTKTTDAKERTVTITYNYDVYSRDWKLVRRKD